MPPDTRNSNDNQALADFANQYTTGYKDLLAGQDAKQQGLFDQYTTAVNGQEKLPDLYGRLQTELGIPGLSSDVSGYKSQIYRVQGLLDRLNDDVTSRTRGTYTTQALQDKIIGSEGAQYNTELGRLGTGLQPLVDQLTGAQGQLSTLLPLYEQQQQNDLDPLKMQISALGDQFARQISGYTASNEQQLNALTDKLTRDRQLSDQDWQLAQDLAKQESDYQHNLALAKVSAGGAGAGGSTPAAPAGTTPAAYSSWSAGDQTAANNYVKQLIDLRTTDPLTFATTVNALRQGAQNGVAKSAAAYSIGQKLGYWK